MLREIRQYCYNYKNGKRRCDDAVRLEITREMALKEMRCLDNIGLERHENANVIYYDRPDIRNAFTRYIYYK